MLAESPESNLFDPGEVFSGPWSRIPQDSLALPTLNVWEEKITDEHQTYSDVNCDFVDSCYSS